MPPLLAEAIQDACEGMDSWLRELPEWPQHPTNASGSVSSHFGPTILSEHDCVMHFARFLHDAGVAWEDIHMEFSAGQWMFVPRDGAGLPKRIDLVVIDHERLANARLPAGVGGFKLEAVFEFALASNYWKHGAGSAAKARRKVAGDVDKVGEYLLLGLAECGYVIVVEECDHAFPAEYDHGSVEPSGVCVRVLKRPSSDGAGAACSEPRAGELRRTLLQSRA